MLWKARDIPNVNMQHNDLINTFEVEKNVNVKEMNVNVFEMIRLTYYKPSGNFSLSIWRR